MEVNGNTMLNGVRSEEMFKRGKWQFRLDGYENINNKEYHKCITVYSGIPGAESETIYYREADDGIYAINGKFKDSPEYLDTKLPLEVGSSWTSTPPLAVTKSRVLNTETLELIGKTYKDCLRISYSSSSNRGNINGYLLVAKNVGMVKNVMEINGITLDISLEKYQE